MNWTFKKFVICVLALLVAQGGTALQAGNLVLWYQQPAGNTFNGSATPFVNEALPVGNGRLGGLIGGGPARERIVLNQDSLWTGDENPSGNDGTMGAYQCLGDLCLNLPGHENFADYRRDLDIGNALAPVKLPIRWRPVPSRIFLPAIPIGVPHRTAHRRPARQLHRQH